MLICVVLGLGVLVAGVVLVVLGLRVPRRVFLRLVVVVGARMLRVLLLILLVCLLVLLLLLGLVALRALVVVMAALVDHLLLVV
jgi:hypothetical protein